MTQYWMIIDKTTGKHIPLPKSVGKRGYTHVEPTHEGIPRLFETENKAKCALREWLKGTHIASVEYDGDEWSSYSYTIIDIEREPSRIKENMMVVAVEIKVENLYVSRNQRQA